MARSVGKNGHKNDTENNEIWTLLKMLVLYTNGSVCVVTHIEDIHFDLLPCFESCLGNVL